MGVSPVAARESLCPQGLLIVTLHARMSVCCRTRPVVQLKRSEHAELSQPNVANVPPVGVGGVPPPVAKLVVGVGGPDPTAAWHSILAVTRLGRCMNAALQPHHERALESNPRCDAKALTMLLAACLAVLTRAWRRRWGRRGAASR